MRDESVSVTDATQASTRDFAAWEPGRAETIATALAHLPGACLPILHELQDEFGYIHQDAIPIVAEALNLSRAEVVGVVSFYHDFRQAPPGEHVVRICRGEACQSMGGEALVEHLETGLATKLGDTTSDGAISLSAAYCLGNCALSPAMMVDDRLHGRVTPERATGLLATIA